MNEPTHWLVTYDTKNDAIDLHRIDVIDGVVTVSKPVASMPGILRGTYLRAEIVRRLIELPRSPEHQARDYLGAWLYPHSSTMAQLSLDMSAAFPPTNS